MTDKDKIEILCKALDEVIEYAVMSNEARYGTLSSRLMEQIATEALDKIGRLYD